MDLPDQNPERALLLNPTRLDLHQLLLPHDNTLPFPPRSTQLVDHDYSDQDRSSQIYEHPPDLPM